jgi:hypothetical protein
VTSVLPVTTIVVTSFRVDDFLVLLHGEHLEDGWWLEVLLSLSKLSSKVGKIHQWWRWGASPAHSNIVEVEIEGQIGHMYGWWGCWCDLHRPVFNRFTESGTLETELAMKPTKAKALAKGDGKYVGVDLDVGHKILFRLFQNSYDGRQPSWYFLDSNWGEVMHPDVTLLWMFRPQETSCTKDPKFVYNCFSIISRWLDEILRKYTSHDYGCCEVGGDVERMFRLHDRALPCHI